MPTFDEEYARAQQQQQMQLPPELLSAAQMYLRQAPQPQTMYPGMIPGYQPSPKTPLPPGYGYGGFDPATTAQAASAEARTGTGAEYGGGRMPPAAANQVSMAQRAFGGAGAGAPAPSLEALLAAHGSVPPPASPMSTAGSQAMQFMGVQGAPGGQKPQDRLPQEAAPKGALGAFPGSPMMGAPGGAGAASGGAAPVQSQHGQQGPLRLPQVMQGLIQANPDMMKSKDGRIALAMAALKFGPLMQREDQHELAMMKMEMTRHLNELKMQQGEAKLQQGEAKLGLQEERLRAYESRLESKGGSGPDKLQKEYDVVAKEANTLAYHLATNKGDKNLQSRYDATMLRLNKLGEKINPTPMAKEYEKWLTSPEVAKASDPATMVASSIPGDVKSNLRPEELRQLTDMLLSDPVNAHLRIMKLREKIRSAGAGGETVMGKQGGFN